MRRSPLLDACAVVAGFHASTPLTETEISAVWPLVAARASVLATSVEDILAADPGNDYAREEQPFDWLILERAASVPFPLAEAALRQAVGLDGGATAALVASWRPDRPVVDPPPGVPLVDLSVTTTLLPEGTWADLPATRAAIAAALSDGYGFAGSGAACRSPGPIPPTSRRACTSVATRSSRSALRSCAPAPGEVVAAGDGRRGDPGRTVDVTLVALEATVAVGAVVAAGDVVGRVIEVPPR